MNERWEEKDELMKQKLKLKKWLGWEKWREVMDEMNEIDDDEMDDQEKMD